MKKLPVAVVVGTRPEAIKMAPVIKELSQSSFLRPVTVSTSQHRHMVEQIFRSFDIQANHELRVMRPSQTLWDLSGRLAAKLGQFLADHPVAQRVLLDLEQIGALHRVEIGPLPADAVRELTEDVIGAVAEPELIDWLGSRAQGNPLFVLGLLQALVEEGGDLARPALRSLPEGLAERVRVRMDRLDDSQGIFSLKPQTQDGS